MNQSALPAVTAHELLALFAETEHAQQSTPFARAMDFPQGEAQAAMMLAGVTTLAVRKLVDAGAEPPHVDERVEPLRALLGSPETWVHLIIRTGAGQRSLRLGLSPRIQFILGERLAGIHEVEIASDSTTPQEFLAATLSSLVEPLSAAPTAQILARSYRAGEDTPVNLLLLNGQASLAAHPLDGEGRLTTQPADNLADAVSRMSLILAG